MRGRRVGAIVPKILLTVNGDIEHLDECISSIRTQNKGSLNLIILNTSPTIKRKRLLSKYSRLDPRIQLVHLPRAITMQNAVDRGLDLISKHASETYDFLRPGRPSTGGLPKETKKHMSSEPSEHFLVFTQPSHIWHPDRLRDQLEYLSRRPDHVAVYTRTILHEDDNMSSIDYFPFSLMIARHRLPFRFNPYDTRSISELTNYGPVGTMQKNLLTLEHSIRQKSEERHILSASFKAHFMHKLQEKVLTTSRITRLAQTFTQGLKLTSGL